MVVYTTLEITTMIFAYANGCVLNDGQNLFEDLILMGPIFFTILMSEAKGKLDRHKPEVSLFEWHNVASLVVGCLWVVLAQICILVLLAHQDFYKGT